MVDQTRRMRARAPAPAEVPTPRTAQRRAVRSEPATRSSSSSTSLGRSVAREEAQEELLSNRLFSAEQQPAFVRINAGRTYNLGNFESLRLDVSVTLPCLPSEVDSAYELASNYVVEKMAEEEAIWLSGNNSASNTTRQAQRRRG